ncbi:MAG: cytochrome c [Saprospirales bacterium]|nr:cytochrome c [Saprospirales bacterium]MBK8921131.1 cytochrome c [Saprospirales bacterium]
MKVFRVLSAVFLFLFFGLKCQQNPYREGARLYQVHCANCHMDDGAGLSALIPPLAGSGFLKTHRERLPCILKYGLKDTIQVNGKQYAEQMPGVPTLSAVHITNILNYIQTSWGNQEQPFRLDDVEALLEACKR